MGYLRSKMGMPLGSRRLRLKHDASKWPARTNNKHEHVGVRAHVFLFVQAAAGSHDRRRWLPAGYLHSGDVQGKKGMPRSWVDPGSQMQL